MTIQARAIGNLEIFALQLGASIEGFAVVTAIWIIRPLRIDLGAPIVWDSYLFGIYPVIAAIAGFFWAEVTNKRGCKRSLLACYAIVAVSWPLLAVPNLWCMLVARVLQGASIAHLQGIAFTAIENRAASHEEATGATSIVAAGYGSGFIFSSLVLLATQYLVPDGILADRLALGLLGLVTVFSFCLVQFVLEDTREEQLASPASEAEHSLLYGLREIWEAARDMFGGGSIFLLVMMYLLYGNTVVVDSTLGELSGERFAWGTKEAAILSCTIGVTILLVQLALPRGLKGYRDWQLLVASTAVLVLSTLLLAVPFGIGIFSVAILCKTAAYAIAIPLLNQFVARSGQARFTAQRLELAVSTKESAVALASFIGKWLLIFGVGAPAFFGAGVIAVGLVVLWVERQKLPAPNMPNNGL